MSGIGEPLGSVASEGGPLVLLDARLAAAWSGIDGPDYDRACALLERGIATGPGGALEVGSEAAVVWDPGGSGVARAFRCGDDLALVRWWGPDVTRPPEASLLDLPAEGRTRLGRIRVSSSRLLVLWATENGAGILGLPAPPEGPVRGDLATGGSGLVVSCRPGWYEVVHDTFGGEAGPGRRCWVRYQG